MPNPSQAPRRAIVYCIVPRQLAARLHEPLRQHFAGETAVEVVVERRESERRAAGHRRRGTASVDVERRAVRAGDGRRAGERRAPVVAVPAPSLPRAARGWARELTFIERIEQPTLQAEDVDSQRLVAAVQGGDRDAFAELYMRYFDRVYSYMRVVVRDAHEAEEATQQVFLNVLTAIPRYSYERAPFRAWVFAIARNEAITVLRKQGRLEPMDPTAIDSRRERPADEEASLAALRWVSDRELVMLIERLPLPQRQALMLRYMLDLSTGEIARIMDRRPDDVRMLLHRAQRFLRDRLVALGRHSETGRPQPMMRRPGHARILRRRRFALL